MWVGERSAWNESMPISPGACRLFPGSVKSGGTWQVAHFDGPLKTILPRSNAALSYAPKGKLPAGVCLIIIDGVDGPTSTASKCQGVGASGATMKETVHERVYQNRRRSGQAVYSAVMQMREDNPKRLLSGEAFTAAGINGAVESDFFDWIVADAEGEELVRRIMAHVRRFRLAGDVLKILYESLIDRDERHGLGEYYTPDWLAAKIVKATVTAPLEQRVLDPACGSGTFLFRVPLRKGT
jgi:hypothetical protein